MGTTIITPTQRGANIRRLNNNQRTFIECLLSDNAFCPTKAARAAGYKNPAQAANKLLKNPIVRKALGKAIQDRANKHELEAADVLNHLRTALFLDPMDVFKSVGNGRYVIKNLEDIPQDIRRCITKIKCVPRSKGDSKETVIEVEFMSKDSALQSAMKHLGLVEPDGVVVGDVSSGFLGELLERVEKNRNVIDGTVIGILAESNNGDGRSRN